VYLTILHTKKNKKILIGWEGLEVPLNPNKIFPKETIMTKNNWHKQACKWGLPT
jgi:hypothetical protein